MNPDGKSWCLLNRSRSPRPVWAENHAAQGEKGSFGEKKRKKTGNAEGGIISELVGRSLLLYHWRSATCTVTAI